MINGCRTPLHRFLIAGAALAWIAGSSGSGSAQSQPATSVAGMIDIHVHSEPDSIARSIDAVELTRLAKTRGLRALVLKNHYESTASLAFIVRKVVPGIEIFGGVDLNLSVGGINPAAVEYMTKVTGHWGRVVWFPTFDSEHQVRSARENRPFVSVSRDGDLLPEAKHVIALIASHRLVLATGHSSPAEVLMLIREAKRQGVRQMVVTHAMIPPVGMTIAEMQEAAREGAYIEFVYQALLGRMPPVTLRQYAAAIRAIGPDSCILSTDLGQAGNPLHPDGLAAFVMGLKAEGFSDRDIDRMTKDNPAQLLGL